MTSLKQKTVSGVVWTAIESVGQYAIQLVITIVLARILSPTDFGTIEMLLIFTALTRVFIESGFSQSLIRKNDVDTVDLNSVFYFNVLLSIVIYIILYFASPFVAAFYKTPELTSIARVIFITEIINAFGIIHIAIISIDLNFKILTRSSIFAAFISAIVGILAAKLGYGVWSLVYQTLSFAIIKTISLWYYNKWRPSLIFSMAPIKEMFTFSSKLLMVNLLDVLFLNIQSLLIGRLYKKSDLGFYGQAKRFQSIPSNTLTQVIQKVTYPILSKIQNEANRFKEAYAKVIMLTIFFVFPMMLGLLVMGNNLFYIILTPKWLPAVQYFQPLCLVGVLFPLYSINLNIVIAKGQGNLYLKIGFIKRITVLVAILATIKFSVLALVWGQVAATLINSLITMFYSGKLINYTIKDQIKDIFPTLLLSSIMAGSMYGLGEVVPFHNKYIILICQVIAGGAIYIIAAKSFNFLAFKELHSIFIRKNNKVSV
jgi:teichuronic acid exporter